MPRIHPKTLLKAREIDKALLALLPVCRDIASARNELRWLHEHATFVSHRVALDQSSVLCDFVRRRAYGEPLQYILGSEYFGNLEIKCRPGVLIPRQETAASVSHLVSMLRSDIDRDLRVLDLCTGSGCIPLLFHDEYYGDTGHRTGSLQVISVDISVEALSLARQNLLHQLASQARREDSDGQRMRSLHNFGFVHADILENDERNGSPRLTEALQRIRSDPDQTKFDILISNPPYISPNGFRSTTTRSVRRYEPRLALVPPKLSGQSDLANGDLFYPRLVQIAEEVEAKMLLFEVADLEQAKRVVVMLARNVWDTIEIWRDEPSSREWREVMFGNKLVKVKGAGHGRSVFAWRGDGISLLKDRPVA